MLWMLSILQDVVQLIINSWSENGAQLKQYNSGEGFDICMFAVQI
jgi:hypothetical protein